MSESTTTKGRHIRTKAEQIMDIIENMTPKQLGLLGGLWFRREPEQLLIFKRRLSEYERSLE